MMWYEEDEIKHLLVKAGLTQLTASTWFAPRTSVATGDRHISFMDEGVILRTEFVDGQKLETTHVRPNPNADLLVMSILEHVEKLYETDFDHVDGSKLQSN